MYLVTIHVPTYTDGPDRLSVATDWYRSLVLLRDSFSGRFGTLAVLAPSLPVTENRSAQKLHEVNESRDGIRLIPSFDNRARARTYWIGGARKRWKADLARHASAADVVHAGVGDVYRPIGFDGFRAGLAFGKTTVFVQDTDIVLQNQELSRGQGLYWRCRTKLYSAAYARLVRSGVARADVSLLKGTTLLKRYGGYAKNAKVFHDTSYSRAEIVGRDAVAERIRTQQSGRAMRFVYCGRFIPRKGIDHGIRIVRAARDLGADVGFDLIGEGPQQTELTSLVNELGVRQHVRFLGSVPYGPELIRRLATYDGLLFTPLAEDTPRMIFDGYAAALPLVAYDIEYVKERAAEERATFDLPRNDVKTSAERIAKLAKNRGQLTELTNAAHAAAETHCAESWYRRRAEWTIEAHERRRVEPVSIPTLVPSPGTPGEG
ncbi:MAG: glycosyltransferase [Tepidisphaeraceae bacterium]